MSMTRSNILFRVSLAFIGAALLTFAVVGLMLKLQIERDVIVGNQVQTSADTRSLENQKNVLKNQEEILQILHRLDKIESEVGTIKQTQ